MKNVGLAFPFEEKKRMKSQLLAVLPNLTFVGLVSMVIYFTNLSPLAFIGLSSASASGCESLISTYSDAGRGQLFYCKM
jgi:hypothetical protein